MTCCIEPPVVRNTLRPSFVKAWMHVLHVFRGQVKIPLSEGRERKRKIVGCNVAIGCWPTRVLLCWIGLEYRKSASPTTWISRAEKGGGQYAVVLCDTHVFR